MFLGPNDEIVVASHVRETQRVLRECTGYLPIDAVRARVRGVDDATFQAVIEAGLANGYIQDSRRLYQDFHEDSIRHLHEYDPDVVAELLAQSKELSIDGDPIGSTELAADGLRKSALFDILSKRRTVRTFGALRIPEETLAAFLRCIYWNGDGPRPTPSAGGLYALQLYLVTTDGIQTERPAVLRFDATRGVVHDLGRPISPELLAHALDCPQPPNGYVVFVVAAVERIWTKYSNRAYRLALLEAGHVAQNAYLFGADSRLGILEYAGADQQMVAKLLGLDYPRQILLTTLVVGYESADAGNPFSNHLLDLLHRLKSSFVGLDRPIEWVQMVKFGTPPYEFQRAAAVCDYRDPKGGGRAPRTIERRCQGTSTSSAEAAIKAIAEGYERYVSGVVRWDVATTAGQLEFAGQAWVDPREYAPYSLHHYKGPLRHLMPFDPTHQWQWCHGSRLLTGESVHIPVDLVFYPVNRSEVGRRLCYEATSSGVAAATDTPTAARRALFELIERDAICITWYCKRDVVALPIEALGADVLLRVRRWRSLGWDVRCLNITTDSVPVVLSIIFSGDIRPHFVSGAAAADTFPEAATKALDEAELMLTARRRTKGRRKAESRIRTPLDHGMMYFDRESLRRVKWLLTSPTAEVEGGAPSWADLVDRYDPIQVELAVGGTAGPLSVVRVLSRHLLPISFGFGTEHFQHPRARALGLKWQRSYPATPHFFA